MIVVSTVRHIYSSCKKLQRCPNLVSRYVREYEAVVGATSHILNQK